jgi:hypothetical protein
MYEMAFDVGWFDCDANRHLKNTAFSNMRSKRGSLFERK